MARLKKISPIPTTKNAFVDQLSEELGDDDMVIFMCSCVSETIFASAPEIIQEHVQRWWSLPNIGTMHIFDTEEATSA